MNVNQDTIYKFIQKILLKAHEINFGRIQLTEEIILIMV